MSAWSHKLIPLGDLVKTLDFYFFIIAKECEMMRNDRNEKYNFWLLVTGLASVKAAEPDFSITWIVAEVPV